ncbi:MAG: hypothetical protein IJY48_02930, partial [Mailhella sp.]|nr:hypothetical protein [Mailhella sp.]
MSKFKCEFEFELIDAFCQRKNHTTKEFLTVFRGRAGKMAPDMKKGRLWRDRAGLDASVRRGSPTIPGMTRERPDGGEQMTRTYSGSSVPHAMRWKSRGFHRW